MPYRPMPLWSLRKPSDLAVHRMVSRARRCAPRESRPGELVLELVHAQHVAHVLIQEALDALAELLHAIDVALLPAPVGVLGRGENAGIRLLTS